MIVVGDTVFVHGGVLPSHVRYGLGRINDEARRWMRGESQRLPEILNGDSAPTWTREYSEGEPGESACNDLGNALDALTRSAWSLGTRHRRAASRAAAVSAYGASTSGFLAAAARRRWRFATVTLVR